MNFEWDEAKSDECRVKRGFDFELALLIFAGHVVETIDDRHDYREIRIRAVGEVEGQILHVFYTDRDDARRIISARKANRKERELWRSSANP